MLLEAGPRLGGRAWTQQISGLDLDLGCEWFHSADRNAWVGIAEAAGVVIDRTGAKWGVQHRDLGFSKAEQVVARNDFGMWMQRLENLRASDCAADALTPGCEWNDYIRTIVGFISGGSLERLSVADYLAYDEASSESNWRTPSGLGALIAGSVPAPTTRHLSTAAESIVLDAHGVAVTTPAGTLRARSAILTVSSAVLAGDTMKLPSGLDAWRHAASLLPLGRNEKLFFEIHGDSPFEPESQVLGNPRDARTGSYYIRPLGAAVIECFFGAEGARQLEDGGEAAAFEYATDQLCALFGAGVRAVLRPLAASHWSADPRIGGAYSYALPGHAAARATLARPCEDRLFFAGEATSTGDFSTAHGAHDSGVRAADEAIAALT